MSTPRSAARADAALVELSPFAEDVRSGLLGAPKRVPPRWFYDALGSALFEAICQLPWYRITRSETELLGRHAGAIVTAAGDASPFIELGAGSGEKLAILVARAVRDGLNPEVHLIDVSLRALELASATLARFAGVRVTAHEATYDAGLPRATALSPRRGRQLVLFLGSNIGNFDPGEALGLLRHIADHLRPGDLVLVGADLVKPERELLLAYDDPLGLTAAFNKNLLLRMHGELGAEIDLESFVHEARWDGTHARVEMHLVSTRRQVIDIPRAACQIAFERGESIWTESSYKFQPRGLVQLGARAGLAMIEQWVDGSAGFALTLFHV
ncbi:MAG TPA: L-histidine N(alpha)-methyltransferase [Vicinamibacterales bacterium]|nr:L-histidine N(alpha)-methyltransferase [Vicinamibacterales bacterium]